eukprot:8941-Heterococcus_DN1.PRE.1
MHDTHTDSCTFVPHVQVVTDEIAAILQACDEMPEYDAADMYTPKLTVITCQKRHHTRLFPVELDPREKSGNVPAGTVPVYNIILAMLVLTSSGHRFMDIVVQNAAGSSSLHSITTLHSSTTTAIITAITATNTTSTATYAYCRQDTADAQSTMSGNSRGSGNAAAAAAAASTSTAGNYNSGTPDWDAVYQPVHEQLKKMSVPFTRAVAQERSSLHQLMLLGACIASSTTSQQL